MGISTSAKLIVGLPYEELKSLYERHEDERDAMGGDPASYDDFRGWTEELGLDSASPSYDCGEDEEIYGFDVARSNAYTEVEVSAEWLAKISELKIKFAEVTGLMPKVYLTPHIT